MQYIKNISFYNIFNNIKVSGEGYRYVCIIVYHLTFRPPKQKHWKSDNITLRNQRGGDEIVKEDRER